MEKISWSERISNKEVQTPIEETRTLIMNVKIWRRWDKW